MTLSWRLRIGWTRFKMHYGWWRIGIGWNGRQCSICEWEREQGKKTSHDH